MKTHLTSLVGPKSLKIKSSNNALSTACESTQKNLETPFVSVPSEKFKFSAKNKFMNMRRKYKNKRRNGKVNSRLLSKSIALDEINDFRNVNLHSSINHEY
mmetsp:Transcript_7369/g.8323  ORF Transcript_7369/g.8323 Transcript_7369/m.8323 type:complete len:101 (+) Transcript_7369:423-725(+)